MLLIPDELMEDCNDFSELSDSDTGGYLLSEPEVAIPAATLAALTVVGGRYGAYKSGLNRKDM
ncbi:hypothetical protein A3F06_02125 [candidate division TM6 bacterium RIFCSPHIGHO2_12_FULL_36_22]|nr:MAG: hypothetical protein A3F06_02125 [candidate division TM6 bacterium RIFCSPHIGHO2_12_FULL_36_22]